jgi:CubicO group peptidase (beta-lactamase class C family)
MQRVLLVIVLLLLLAASLAVGTLAAAWPFWTRALAWHSAPDGWPGTLPGPVRELRPAAASPRLDFHVDPTLAADAAASGAQVLLVADGPSTVRAYFAAGYDEHGIVDGRGLAPGLLPLVYAALEQDHPGLLDQPLGQHLAEWSGHARGAITRRQLLWARGGLAGAPQRPWNLFSPQAQLLAGPDFMRAALAVRQEFPAGTTYTPSPANAQLLALLASRLTSRPYADLLESVLWQRAAADVARATLDHPRGEIAAHCCIGASAGDWLRVALLLAQSGRSGPGALLPASALAQISRDHPVNPGQGLVWRVERQDDSELLLLESEGRLLAAAPASGRALFWLGEGRLQPGHAARLLGVGDIKTRDSDQLE